LYACGEEVEEVELGGWDCFVVKYRFEGADDSVNPRFNLGFPDETFNMFVGCKNLSNTH
jgi:hypothetical protein